MKLVNRFPWFLIATLFSVVFALILSPLIFHLVQPMWDAVQEFYPSFAYIADAFREGRFPFWDPYTNCGYPFHAEPHQPTLNPLVFLLSMTVKNNWTGFILFWLFHWWVGGVGMIALSRYLGANVWGGFLAAMAFVFSGFFIGNSEHTPFIITVGWIPLVFLFGDLGVKYRHWGAVLLSAFFMAMSTLGGYPPLSAFTGLALGFWLVLRYRQKWKLIFIVLAIVGVLVGLVYLPMIHAFVTEGAAHTERISAVQPERANFSDPFSLPAYFTLFLPVVNGLAKGLGADISMTNGYCGILSLVFAFFWWRNRGTEKKPWWWLFFLIFMMLVSFGGKAGLRTLLYYVYPPLKYVRYSSVFRIYWIFAIALAAGLGFTQFLRWESKKKDNLAFNKLFSSFLKLNLLVFILFIVYQASMGGKFLLLSVLLPSSFLILMGTVIVLKAKKKMALAFSFLFVADFAAFVYTSGTLWEPPVDMVKFAERHEGSTTVLGEPGGREGPNAFFDQQSSKKAEIFGYIAMQVKDYDHVLVKSAYASVLMSPTRFWLTQNARLSQSHSETLNSLTGVKPNGNVPVWIEGALPDGFSGQDVIPGSYGKTKILSYAPEKIEMEVEVPEGRDAILASTEKWGKSWIAKVDGIATPVLMVNLFFRGLVLKPGFHRITWSYEPHLWTYLVVLSESVLMITLILGVYLYYGKKRRSSEELIADET